jgi:hypothetical protein
MIKFSQTLKKFITISGEQLFAYFQSLPMDIQLKLLMILSISVDKGWDYGHEDNILIINLHDLMIISNNDYEN